MKLLHIVAYLLLFVGGLNWGLIGLFNYNLVGSLLASWPAVVNIVYVLVGVATIYIAATHMGDCKVCSKK